MLVHVDANNFYASCEKVFDPTLRDRPVVVLSNNDGVVVARSSEAKALNIDMARPYFQIADLLRRYDVRVLSSNYTLYDDMSNRLAAVYRRFTDALEIYSIDECFLSFDHVPPDRLDAEARRLRTTAGRWTGIPVGVGVAATKTLAKLANRLAKKVPANDGVCVLGDAASVRDALGRIELTDLWGVSRGFQCRLRSLGIATPLELAEADSHLVRRRLGVVGQRIALELRGQRCIPMEVIAPDKQTVCCSRSFGTETRRFDDLRQAVCTFASQAMVKLRRQDLAAGAVTVFVDTNIHAPPGVKQYHNARTTGLPTASCDTREIAAAAVRALRRVYRPGYSYKKAGVLLHRLVKRSGVQPNLFDRRDHGRAGRLMATVDRINRRFGRGAVRIAAAVPFGMAPSGLTAGRTVHWRGRCDRRSRCYTTRWDELPICYAKSA
ncbi:MAG: Y-family DNA polymerase [Phycisphaerae bacterium]|nr:Y-family DNA polymerase [Phycisphaerae bacterium]